MVAIVVAIMVIKMAEFVRDLVGPVASGLRARLPIDGRLTTQKDADR